MKVLNMNLHTLYESIVTSERYKLNIQYGAPRRGHDEGSVANHIQELEQNLDTLVHKHDIHPTTFMKLLILIHVHDSFKMESARDVPILDPKSHATLAREFLESLGVKDSDLLTITQYHDLGFALYRNRKPDGRYNEERLTNVLQRIDDKDLFLTFAIIDCCTKSKGREMIRWLVGEVRRVFPYVCKVDESWILEGEERIGEVF